MSEHKEVQSCCCGHDHDHCGCEHQHHEHHDHCGCEHEHHEHHDHCGCEHEHHEHHDHCGCHHEHHEHTCTCGCHHEHHDYKTMCLRIGLSVLLSVLGLFLNGWVSVVSFAAAYIIIGCDILAGSVKDIFKYHVLGENLLMTVASLGAFALGEYIEAVAVMLLYQIGELLQDRAVEKSRNAISALSSIRSETVNLECDGILKVVDVHSVRTGDIFIVKAGELIALDGKIISGSCEVDTKALTGESLPVFKEAGDTVLGGSTNLNGLIRVEASSEYFGSTVAKILRLVEESESRKSNAESFIRKFAKIYTPVVFFVAVFVAFVLPLIFGRPFSEYIYSALVFLTVSCPCALVISVPLTYFAGIGGASKKGILVKGANFIDMLAKADSFVFDKTGTLTEGEFSVTGLYPEGVSEEELLNIICSAESGSNHPVALAVCKYNGNKENDIIDIKEIAGRGVIAKTQYGTVIVGNSKLLEDEGIGLKTCIFEGSVLYVALEGKYIGAVTVNVKVKDEAKETINRLKVLNIQNISMLTGDNELAAASVAKELGIINYKAGLLPQDKVSAYEHSKGKITVFVGDGINDAPVLNVADVGIAMGGIGSDSAIEAADVIIMDDNLNRIADGISVCRKTRRIALQNVILALAVKTAVMVLGLFGLMWLWLSIIADVGVCMVAVLNSLRALKTK